MTTSNKALHRVGSMYSQRSGGESDIDGRLREHLTDLLPRLGHSWNWDIQVTLKRQAFSRLIWFYELYKKILDVQGSILEFGVQWGATLTTMSNCRSMFEPFNYARKICGFDTFEGFTTIDEKDGGFSESGMYSVSSGYEEVLEDILRLHEGMSPAPHIEKFELVKGDASVTFPTWLEANPHAVIAMAIFDMDVYKPTKDVLEMVIPKLTKGSLLVFDELNCAFFPGETQALHDVLGLNKLALHCVPYQPYASWAVWEG